jgi:phosphoglycerol transferase
MIRPVTLRTDILATLMLLLLITGALLLVLPPPNGWLGVPFCYEGDCLWNLFLIKTVIETGWYYDNAHLGAPFTAAFLDFAKPETLHLLLIRAMGLLTDNIACIHNSFYLFGFYSVAVAALWVLRGGLALNWSMAVAGAFLFTWLPYHFYRLPHLFLSNYFVVPIAIWLMLRVTHDELGSQCNIKSFVARPGVWLACAAVASTSLYYAYFSILLVITVGALGAVRERCAQRFAVALAVGAAIGLVAAINLTPSIIYRLENGTNPEVAQRNIGELDIYALNPLLMVAPSMNHRSDPLTKLARQYTERTEPENESQTSSLGLVGTLGFFILLIHLLGCRSTIGNRPQFKTLCQLNAASLLIGVKGGGGALIGVLLTPQFRAMNRISVFIAFLSLGGFLIWLEHVWPSVQSWLWRRVSVQLAKTRSWGVKNHGWIFISVTVITFGLWDQTILKRYKDPGLTQARFESDHTFVKAIERRLGPNARVYQMPYIAFPEVPPSFQESSYAQIVGYLHSQTLQWSFGAFKGRPEELWHRAISRLDVDEQIKQIRQAGFRGISLNRQALADQGIGLEQALVKNGARLGHTSQQGDLVFFELEPTGGVPELLPLPIVWGEGFHAEEFDGENRWAWSHGTARLLICSNSTKAVPVVMHLELLSLTERQIAIVVTGSEPRQIMLTTGRPEKLELTTTAMPGYTQVLLSTDRPAAAASRLDPRQLAVMVRNPRIQFARND